MHVDKELNSYYDKCHDVGLLSECLMLDVEENIRFLYLNLHVSKEDAEELIIHCESNIDKLKYIANDIGQGPHDTWFDYIEIEILAYRLFKIDKCSKRVSYNILNWKISNCYDNFYCDNQKFEIMIMHLSKIIVDLDEVLESVKEYCFIQDCIKMVDYKKNIEDGNFIKAYNILENIMRNIIINEDNYCNKNTKEIHKDWIVNKFEAFVSTAIAADKLQNLKNFLASLFEKRKFYSLSDENIKEMRFRIVVEEVLRNNINKDFAKDVNRLFNTFENYNLIDEEYKRNNSRLGILVLYMRFLEKKVITDNNEIHVESCKKLIKVCSKINDIYKDDYIYIFMNYPQLINYIERSYDVSINARLLLCKAKTEPLDNFLELIEENCGDNYIIKRVFKTLASAYFNKSLEQSKDNIKRVVGYFINLYMDIMNIEQILRVKEYKGKEFAYYTTLDTFSYLLLDNESDLNKGQANKYRLKLMNARYMNDPNEGIVLLDIFKAHKVNKSNIFNRLNGTYDKKMRKEYNKTQVFLKSFSNKIDKLTMWTQYGDKGKGCCVVVDGKTFKDINTKLALINNELNDSKIASDDYDLFNVVYWDSKSERFTINGKENKDIKEKIEKIANDIVQIGEVIELIENSLGKDHEFIFKITEMINDFLSRLCYLIKYDEYQDENEVRLVFQRDVYSNKRNDIIELKNDRNKLSSMLCINYPMKTLIKEVILGPKVEDADKYAPYMAMKLADINLDGDYETKLTSSSIDYR